MHIKKQPGLDQEQELLTLPLLVKSQRDPKAELKSEDVCSHTAQKRAG